MFPSRRASVLSKAQGFHENSIRFDGVDDYITIADNALFDHDDGSETHFSASIWYNSSLVAIQSGKLFGHSATGGNTEWNVSHVASGTNVGKINFATPAADHTASSNNAVYTNLSSATFPANRVWTHLAVAIDGSADKLYIWKNGVLVKDAGFNHNPRWFSADAPFEIGRAGAVSSPPYWRGNMCSLFYVKQYTFSQADVNTIYNGGKTRDLSSVLTGETRGWWKLGDGDNAGSNGIKDSIGSVHGTMTNMNSSNISSEVPE